MSKTPIVRPLSIWGSVVTLTVLAGFATLGWIVSREPIGVAVEALAFIVVSKSLRYYFGRYHARGITRCKRQQFEEAIPLFQKSLGFFNSNEWIDEYRCLTMLSAAAMGYREMALVSLGFCYSQLGDGQLARKYYQECLERFPENGMAEAALNLMDAASQATKETS